MQLEHRFSAEQILQGSGHNTQVLKEIKSYPSMQLKQFVAKPVHVLQGSVHLTHFPPVII